VCDAREASEGQTFLSFVAYVGPVVSYCEIRAWLIFAGIGSWFLEEGRYEGGLAG
jgi:hypothetical protein